MEEEKSEAAEYEISGTGFAIFFALFFYAGVLLALSATIASLSIWIILVGIGMVFFSVFAIATSPTYLRIEGDYLVLERVRFFLTFSRSIPVNKLNKVLVKESRSSTRWAEGEPPAKDVSYFVHVYIYAGKKRIRVFRSSLNHPPGENRARALEVAENLSMLTGIPVERTFK